MSPLGLQTAPLLSQECTFPLSEVENRRVQKKPIKKSLWQDFQLRSMSIFSIPLLSQNIGFLFLHHVSSALQASRPLQSSASCPNIDVNGQVIVFV